MNTNSSAYRILCYGDSNTWGSKDDRHGRYDADVRWPGVLQQELGNEYEVIENGVGGRTIASDDSTFFVPDARNGLTHLPAVLHAQRPTDLVIIQLGTNDLHEQYGLTIDQIADHLRALIDLVQSYDYKGFCVQDILINLPIHPSDESRMVISRGDLAERFGQVAHEKGCYVFDLNEVGEIGRDGLHYRLETHRRIGEALAKKVLFIRGM